MQSDRFAGLDILKVIAMFMVVYIHSQILNVYGEFIKSWCRIGPPVFIMITGYFWERTTDLKKQTHRIVKMLWLLVGACLFCYVVSPGSFVPSEKKWINLFVFNDFFGAEHLWYLFAMLYVLIIARILGKRMKYLLYTAPLLLLASIVLSKYSYVFLGVHYPEMYARNFLLTGIPYFCLGQAVMRYQKQLEMKLKGKRWILLAVGAALMVINVLENYMLMATGTDSPGDQFFSTPLLTVTVFLFFLYTFDQPPRHVLTRLAARIGRQDVMYVYVIHVAVMVYMNHLVDTFGLRNNRFHYFSAILVFGFSVLIAEGFIALRRFMLHKKSAKLNP